MKIKFNLNFIINVAVVAVALFLLADFLLSSYHMPGLHNIWGTKSKIYTIKDNLPPIYLPLNDSLPHRDYIKLKNDMELRRKLRNGEMIAGNSVMAGFFLGTYTAMQCDTCTTYPYHPKQLPQLHYITLLGWDLKLRTKQYFDSDSVYYYVKQGQAYLRKPVADKVVEKAGGSTFIDAHMVDVPVKFRYTSIQHCVMIPVSKNTESYCFYLISGLAFSIILYVLYLFAAFLNLIVDISKGAVFTEQNVARLRLISLSILLMPLALLIVNFLIRLVFSNYLTEDVVLKTELFSNTWKFFVLGIVFLLFYKAFRQGRLLEEEADLTI